MRRRWEGDTVYRLLVLECIGEDRHCAGVVESSLVA